MRFDMILLTGGTGNLGGAIRSVMNRNRIKLMVTSREESLFSTGEYEKIYKSSLDSLETWIDLIKDVDVVFHLSGLTSLDITEKNIQQSYNANVIPIKFLIEAAKKTNRKDLLVVFASTATVFGINHQNPVNENTPVFPISNYDRHKIEAENLLKEATEKKILKSCSLRLANVYGVMGGNITRNRNRGILNMMMRKALNGQDLVVYGEESNIRDFIHISDVVSAFMAVINEVKSLDGSPYIISSGIGITLKEAFQIIANEANNNYGQNVSVTSVLQPEGLHPIETRSFIGDFSRLKKITGWYPTIAFAKGIKKDMAKIYNSNGQA